MLRGGTIDGLLRSVLSLALPDAPLTLRLFLRVDELVVDRVCYDSVGGAFLGDVIFMGDARLLLLAFAVISGYNYR